MEELLFDRQPGLKEETGRVLSTLSIFKKKSIVESLIYEEKVRVYRFRPGELIYGRRHYQKALAVIINGRASVKKEITTSRVTIKQSQTGDLFGVAALFSDEDGYVSDIYAVDSCTVAFISQETVSELFMLYPDAALAYISLLSHKINFLNRKLDSFTAPNAYTRLCLFLLENGSITISMQALTDRLGISRMTLYRNLDLLVENGWIKREGKTLTVLDRSALLNASSDEII